MNIEYDPSLVIWHYRIDDCGYDILANNHKFGHVSDIFLAEKTVKLMNNLETTMRQRALIEILADMEPPTCSIN